MKKNILSLIILATVAVMATAQTTPMTMRTFTAGGATVDNSYGVFGQPFGDIVAQNGYEISAGVAQMQLVRDTTYVVMTYGDNYVDERGYDFPNVQNPVQKSLKDSLYLVNGGIYHYDLVEYLYIWICDTMNDKLASDIRYPSVAIDNYCWTRENLRTNLDTKMTYNSDQYPADQINIEKYGYLYTLEDAQTLLCPDGWYLPDETAMNLLKGHDATTIRATEDWNTTEVNTNSTKFTAYPAGEYSAAAERFQGMGTNTDWWSSVSASEGKAVSIQVNYYCNTPMFKEHSVNDGLSVRCVMTPTERDWETLDRSNN